MQSHQIIQSKILSGQMLDAQLKKWHAQGTKIVFTNGCFDIVHLGHIDYLSRASDQGDVLLIGLNTDASVGRLKGPSRPVNNEQARAMLLASMFFVSAVVLFDEDTPLELIRKVQPHILVKGSDYRAEDIVGYDIVKGRGGEVITIDFLPGYSTTSIINKLKE